MKQLFRFTLITLLLVNGLISMVCCIVALRQLHSEALLDRMLIPGVAFLLLLSLVSVVLTIFSGKRPLLLVSVSIVEAMCLSFALISEIELAHHLNWLYLLAGLDALLLIAASIGYLSLDLSNADFQ